MKSLKIFTALLLVYSLSSCETKHDSTSDSVSVQSEEVEAGIFDYIEIDSVQGGMYDMGTYYAPTILIRVKNKSKYDFNESTKVEVTFVHDNEELCSEYEFIQNSSKPPLLPGVIKQIAVKGSRGFTFGRGFDDLKITAFIYINKQKFKEVLITGKQILYYDYITEKNNM